MHTTYERLRHQLIARCEALMTSPEDLAVLSEFKGYTPELYVYIEGDNIQGISATEDVNVSVFDEGAYETAVTFNSVEMTPEQWDAMIEENTKAGHIKAIR